MSEFIYKHVQIQDINIILKNAGLSKIIYKKWIQKRASPNIYSCISLCRSIADYYNCSFERLIYDCIKSVSMYR